MRRLATAVAIGLALSITTTALAEPSLPAQASKTKKCFKKKHGKRVRVKCPKKKKKTPTQTTPTNPAPTNPTPNPTPTTTSPSDTTGQPAIDQMTTELKGGKWVFYTSNTDTSTQYVLNLCADGTFLRTAESVGVLTYRYGTWKVTDAVIFGDGSGRAARVLGSTTQSDPPGAEDYVADIGHRNADDQWIVNDLLARYTPGAAQCSG